MKRRERCVPGEGLRARQGVGASVAWKSEWEDGGPGRGARE